MASLAPSIIPPCGASPDTDACACLIEQAQGILDGITARLADDRTTFCPSDLAALYGVESLLIMATRALLGRV